MKALAAGRRHRFAPVVLLLLALLLTGAGYAALSPDPATASTAASTDDVESGKALFQANCATCHGLEAQGTDLAPSLVGVGAASVHFQVSTGRMPASDVSSAQNERKPPQFNEEQTRQMAAYVASLGPGPAIPSEDQVDPAQGNSARGQDLFRTNCSMCHNPTGSGGALTNGKVAPHLYDATPTQIWEAMRTGPQPMPAFNEAAIDDQGVRDITAYLMEQRGGGASPIGLGGIGSVVEGLWVWIIGLGATIGAAVWIGARSS